MGRVGALCKHSRRVFKGVARQEQVTPHRLICYLLPEHVTLDDQLHCSPNVVSLWAEVSHTLRVVRRVTDAQAQGLKREVMSPSDQAVTAHRDTE